MFYSIRHITRFRYSAPVRESVMELRMQPRSEGPQTLRSFQIATNPRAQLYAYTDHLGNAVYHFNLLRDELLPEAQAAYKAAFASYSLGGSSALDLLDAKGTLLDAQSQYTDALGAVNDARADLERAVGAPLPPAPSPIPHE